MASHTTTSTAHYLPLTPVSVIYQSMSFALSVLNLVLTTLLLKSLVRNSRYHRNLRLLKGNLYIAFYMVACLNLSLSVLTFTKGIVTGAAPPAIFIQLVGSYGPNLWRFTLFAIIIERTVATVCNRFYENCRSLWLPALLIGMSHAAAVFFDVAYYGWGWNLNFVLGILLGTDLVSVFALVSLWALNRSVADLKNRSDIALSQRYQLTENIRTIRVMLPVTGFGTLIDIAGNVVVAIQAAFFRSTFKEAPVFFMMMNLYITVTFFTVMRQDPSTRKRVMSEMDSIRLSSERDYHKPMMPRHTSFEMRNVYGKKIVMEDTPEKRFEELNRMWGKGAKASSARRISGRHEWSSNSVVEL